MCTPESGKYVHLEPGVCVHLEGGEIWRKRGTYYDDKHNSSATPVFAHRHRRFCLKNQASGALLLWRGLFCLFLYFIYLEKNLGKRGVGNKKAALQTVSCRKVKCAAEEINIAAGRGGRPRSKIEITAAGWEEGGDGWSRSRSRSLPEGVGAAVHHPNPRPLF